MFWRSENEVIVEFIKLFRRILKYKTSWVNDDFQIVDISDNTPKVYEKFFEDNEKYPVITLAGSGYTRSNQAFNSFLGTLHSEIVDLGTRGLGLALVDNSHSLSFALPVDIDNDEVLHSMSFYALSTNVGSNFEGLDIVLTPTVPWVSGDIITSASVVNINTSAYKKYFVEFFPSTILSGTSYWLTFSTNSSFLIGIDNTAVNVFKYTYSGSSVQESGSIHGSLYTPPRLRLGGSIEGTIIIKCSDKNSTKRPREILSIIANYIQVLTQAALTRNSGVDNTTLAMDTDDVVDEWLRKDIRIKAVRQGSSQERRRGENDIIHSYDLMIDYYTEWHQDYQKDLLSEIEIDILENTPNLYSDVAIDLDFD